MKKKLMGVLCVLTLSCILVGCSGSDEETETAGADSAAFVRSGLEDAQKDGAKVLEPVVDIVTYSDGSSEDVYGFNVPVPALDEEFDLALVGTKGVWYDHKVKVSNPEKM